MIWFTWRQYRFEILILGAVLLLVIAILLVTGTNIASFAHSIGNTNCPADHCLTAYYKLQNYIQGGAFDGSAFYSLFQYALLALPLLIGMFFGAQIVARELEQGTYRLIWTQGISWSRWLLAKIGGIVTLIVCATAILFRLLLWWKIPVVPILDNLWDYTNYDIWSLSAIAYTLFAFTLGVCAGTIVKKTVPAMAITLVIFVAVRILIAVFWRPYFLPPVVSLTPFNSTQDVPQKNVILVGSVSTVDRQGNPVDAYNGVCKSPPSSGGYVNNTSSAPLQLNMALPLMNINKPLKRASASSGPGGEQPTIITPEQKAYTQCTIAHGFQYKYWYQPATRFWLFQEIESGIYVLMSAMLFALTFWWTKYRIIGK
jgi:ABC-type transport system involved in multi-copper enzyme maturation permease subunit